MPLPPASFQGRAVKLLSRAFTSLPLPLAQKYIGLSVEQLLSGASFVKIVCQCLLKVTRSVAEKHGWLYDASKQILSPTPFPQASAVTVNTQGARVTMKIGPTNDTHPTLQDRLH